MAPQYRRASGPVECRIGPTKAPSERRAGPEFSSANRGLGRSPSTRHRQLGRSLARLAIGVAASWVVVCAPFGAAFSAAGPANSVGAYCPLPEPGETAVCQAPARERYGDFFAAVEAGRIDPAQMAQIEAALTHSADGDEGAAYLALSSLTYGYYRLAHEAGQAPGTNRRLQARLVRWNELLTRVYGSQSTPPALKAAVRTAAEDLAARVPSVGVTCTAGNVEDCENATGLVGALTAIDERASLRSPLSRVIERLLGPPSSPTDTDEADTNE